MTNTKGPSMTRPDSDTSNVDEPFVLTMNNYEASNLHWLLRVSVCIPGLFTGDWNKWLLRKMEALNPQGGANLGEDMTDQLIREYRALRAIAEAAHDVCHAHDPSRGPTLPVDLAKLRAAIDAARKAP